MKDNRAQVIIDPKFQYQIMGVLISGGIGVCAIFLLGLYFFMSKIFSFLETAEGLSSDAKIELYMNWTQMLYMMIALVGFSVFIIWLWAKNFTNKIAGPVFNMNRTLDGFIAGDKTKRIKLREKDYFKELSEKINQALDSSRRD